MSVFLTEQCIDNILNYGIVSAWKKKMGAGAGRGGIIWIP